MTTTDRDMREQVARAVGVAGYNIRAIVDAIQAEFGTVDVNTIPSERFWQIVADHDSTVPVPKRRFLVSYSHVTPFGSGFGSVCHERTDGKLPDFPSLAKLRNEAAAFVRALPADIVILTVSEISAEGEVLI